MENGRKTQKKRKNAIRSEKKRGGALRLTLFCAVRSNTSLHIPGWQNSNLGKGGGKTERIDCPRGDQKNKNISSEGEEKGERGGGG